MKPRWFLLAAIAFAPSLVLAGNPPSERAKAERQRTIEKKAERRAAGKNRVPRRLSTGATAAMERERAAVMQQVEAEAQLRADRQRVFDMAMQGGLARAYRTNPYLGGGVPAGIGAAPFVGSPLGGDFYNPASQSVYLDVPGSNGGRIGVFGTGQGIGIVPVLKDGKNPVGLNK